MQLDKPALRAALRRHWPWVSDPEVGPSAVEAGECDHCGAEARLVLTCGPDGASLGRRCAALAGVQAWCDGHGDEARAALAALGQLPAQADMIARVWWVATGEIRLDPQTFGGQLRLLAIGDGMLDE